MKPNFTGNQLVLAAVVIGASISISNAGDLTIPNTFTAGTPAVAADVNANFAAVESAVDDNDARITTNTNATGTNTINIGINATGIGNNANAIGTNSTNITNNTSAIAALQAGAVSVGGLAFVDDNSTVDSSTECRLAKTVQYSYYLAVPGANTDCDPLASVDLPHGRTLTGVSCGVLDNSATNDLRFLLLRTSLTTGDSDILFEATASVDSPSIQTLSDTTISDPVNATIDNTAYYYFVRFAFSTSDFSTLGLNARIYGCSVNYL